MFELGGLESGLLRYYNFNQGVAGGNNPSETTLNPQGGAVSGTLNNFALSGAASNWIGSGPISYGTAEVLDFDGVDDYVSYSGSWPSYGRCCQNG